MFRASVRWGLPHSRVHCTTPHIQQRSRASRAARARDRAGEGPSHSGRSGIRGRDRGRGTPDRLAPAPCPQSPISAARCREAPSVSRPRGTPSPSPGTALEASQTIFDFSVNLDTMAWEAWRVPDWEFPGAAAEVDFHSLLVPTADSTRALAVIHQMQARRRTPVGREVDGSMGGQGSGAHACSSTGRVS